MSESANCHEFARQLFLHVMHALNFPAVFLSGCDQDRTETSGSTKKSLVNEFANRMIHDYETMNADLARIAVRPPNAGESIRCRLMNSSKVGPSTTASSARAC
jgi:hypothetical protein